MGYSVERQGFATVSALMYSVATDMLANGFTLIFPATMPITAPTTFKFTLEASASVNPRHDTQPWRVHFDVMADQKSKMVVATPTQLRNDGSVALRPMASNASDSIKSEIAGIIGTEALTDSQSNSTSAEMRSFRFIDRSSGSRAVASALEGYAAPMTYRLTISDHGFALFVWEPGTDVYQSAIQNGAEPSLNTGGNYNAWIVVQQPVDKTTGVPLATGRSPVFCLYKLYDKMYQFTVCENDVPVPTVARSATVDYEDNRAVINPYPQVTINEQDKYVVTFPSRLNTPRCTYTEEMDLLGLTSADVIAEDTDVPLRVYGEASDRVYKAMQANAP